MLLKEILRYFIFHPHVNKLMRCKLMQLTTFFYFIYLFIYLFLRFISKGIICILDGILKSLSLLEGMCD